MNQPRVMQYVNETVVELNAPAPSRLRDNAGTPRFYSTPPPHRWVYSMFALCSVPSHGEDSFSYHVLEKETKQSKTFGYETQD